MGEPIAPSEPGTTPEVESTENMDGVLNDAFKLCKTSEVLPINPETSSTDEPWETEVQLDFGKIVRAKSTRRRDIRDGVFVGSDGKRAGFTTEMNGIDYEAINPNDTEELKAATRHNWDIFLDDPEDPRIKIHLDLGRYPFRMAVEHLDESGDKIDGRITVRAGWGEKPSVDYDIGAEDFGNFGDATRLIRDVVGFTKTATLQPRETQPTAPVAPQLAPIV